MPILRQMVERDLPRVNLILSKSFTHARLQSGLQNSRVPLCRIEFLRMYLAGHPDGAFVIEQDEKIVAYCFSRLWGSVGWIGPLSVIPAEEGKGLGKQVVGAAVEVLKSGGAQTIGLELAASSTRNLAFYTKLGFRANKLTVDLLWPVADAAPASSGEGLSILEFGKRSEAKKSHYMEELRQFSGRFQIGLDYSREIQLVNDFGFGDARLVLESDRVIGFILAHTETYSQEECREYLKVNALQVAPDLPITMLARFLSLLEAWAYSQNLSSIYLRVPTRYYRGFRFLLSMGLVVVNSELRMTLQDYPQRDDPEMINFNKWE